MFSAEHLQEKWAPLLNAEGVDEIKDPHRRAVTAVLLENQEKFLRDEQSFQSGSTLTETPTNHANAAGASGGFGQFVSIPSFILVFGVGIGFTIMRKHTLKENELGKALKEDFFLAGWIGFLVGLGFLGAGMDEQFGNIKWGNSIVISNFKTVTIPLLYGYICGKMFEASLTKPVI